MKGLVKVALMILGIISVMMSNLYAGSYIKVWERTYGFKFWDVGYAITLVEDGEFIVAGYTRSFGNGKGDVYLIKINKKGKKIWERTYGGREDDGAYAITSAGDGGCIIVGYTRSFGNRGGDVYIIKINKNGNKIWERTYGGSKWDEAYAVVPTKDGGFIVAGGTESFGNGGKDVYIIKIDKNGKKI